ncbi:pectinesterase [Aspergillus avenaceus]|uniref:Pectinesterase n=1 Tax=Aspergillus avenaceus TaxID=36643 RepID=A0A5N6U336_ASPAV|nr:pectinesterase [Aspergillus avenaceus]
MHPPFLTAAFLFSVLGSASLHERSDRARAPSGCLTVGTSGNYTTIDAALGSLGSSTSDACIFIESGVYHEQLTVDYAGRLTWYGETTEPDTYQENTVTINHTISSPEAGSLAASATVNIKSDLFSMYNINIVNGYGSGAQAVALLANADQIAFYGCQFLGYQDTLYARSGRQYYVKSKIEGAVDYIFGDASAWITQCDIVSNGPGAITASSRETTSDTAWYAIDHCNVQGTSGADLTAEVYLGRPWRILARVIYQYSSLSDIINPKGWTTMAEGASPLYYEYNNTGAGSATSEREYRSSIAAAVNTTTVLGEDFADWVDAGF